MPISLPASDFPKNAGLLKLLYEFVCRGIGATNFLLKHPHRRDWMLKEVVKQVQSVLRHHLCPALLLAERTCGVCCLLAHFEDPFEEEPKPRLPIAVASDGVEPVVVFLAMCFLR